MEIGDWVGIGALTFTLVSFWWMHWRKGKIKVTDPRSFAASSPEANTTVELPLVLYNSGAASRVVRNLKLVLSQDDRRLVLYFNNTASDLGIVEGRQVKWARPFAIGGREAYSDIFSFYNTRDSFAFSASPCTVELRALLDNRKRWKTVCDFSLRIQDDRLKTINSSTFIAYDNDPNPYSVG